MQSATMTNNQMHFKEERLLTRLAETWWRTRTGSPGFHWVMARQALCYPKVKAALADLNWRPDANYKELYSAFISGVAKEGFKAPDFDSWNEGSVQPGLRTLAQKADLRKREASRVRKTTATLVAAAAPKAKPKKADEASGAWPVVHTAPLEVRPPTTTSSRLPAESSSFK